MKSANIPYINLNSNNLNFIFQSLHLNNNCDNNNENDTKLYVLPTKLSKEIIGLN